MRIRKLLFLIPTIILLIVVLSYKTENLDEKNDFENQELAPMDAVPDKLPVGDTFSIVAIDPITGEVGGAGASCVDISTTYPRGVTFLSDFILDANGNILGGIHSQAAYRAQNQARARARMLAGDSPQQILNNVYANDQGGGGPEDRQYGIVDMIGGPGNTIRTAGFTGATNSDYKNHIVGPNYAIQGNIILNQDVLDDMETAFVNTNGSLAEKLMAALQGAKRVGADTRCAPVGKSSLSSFVKVLRPGELSPSLDIYAGNTPNNVDPIDILQNGFNDYLSNQVMSCSNTITSFPYTESFESNFGDWNQNTNNEVDWSRTNASTPSANTGPAAANDGLFFLFTEASGQNVGFPTKRSVIKSPCFSIPNNHSATFTMDYHMFGTNIGTLTVRANDGSGWAPVFVRQSSQGNAWMQAQIDLNAYSGSTIQLEIDSVTGALQTVDSGGFEADTAIDNISFVVERLPIDFIFDAGVWSPNDPSLASSLSIDIDNIQVLSGSPTLAGDVSIGDVSIASGATLNLGNNTINISGDLNNQGVINTAIGILNFNGTEAQAISGNAISVENLELNQTGILSLNTDVFITGIMQLNSGVLQTNDNLTFPDTYNPTTGFHTTGLLDEVNGGSIVGDVNIERYFPANRAFRLISSSVTTSTTIRENWQENGSNVAGFGTHITGSGGSANGFDNTTTNNPSLFQVNVATQSYEVVSNTNVNTINAGDGYLMLFRGDRTVDLSTNTPTPTATLLRTKGALFTGTYNVPQMSVVMNGSSLVANPYQAPVDMAQALANATNVNTRYYHVYDQNIGERGAFVTVDTQNNTNNLTFGGGATVSQANKFLQPHQAAFVNTNANGVATFQFLESFKDVNGSGSDVFFAPPQNSSAINITLSRQGSSQINDGLRIIFSEDDSTEFNTQDALKNSNLDENIATHIDDNLLSIQRRALPTQSDVISISTTNYVVEDYTLNINLENMSFTEGVYLKDNFLESVMPLNQEGLTQINFSVDSSVEGSMDENRFKILFEDNVLSSSDEIFANELYISPNPASDVIVLNAPAAFNITSITIYDIQGKQVHKVNPNLIQRRSTSLNLSILNTAMYIVEIKGDNGQIIRKKLIKK